MCAPPFATKQRPPHLKNPGSATVVSKFSLDHGEQLIIGQGCGLRTYLHTLPQKHLSLRTILYNAHILSGKILHFNFLATGISFTHPAVNFVCFAVLQTGTNSKVRSAKVAFGIHKFVCVYRPKHCEFLTVKNMMKGKTYTIYGNSKEMQKDSENGKVHHTPPDVSPYVLPSPVSNYHPYFLQDDAVGIRVYI